MTHRHTPRTKPPRPARRVPPVTDVLWDTLPLDDDGGDDYWDDAASREELAEGFAAMARLIVQRFDRLERLLGKETDATKT